MEPNQMAEQQPHGTQSQGGGMKTLWAIVILVVVVGGGWYVYQGGAFKRGVENAPEISREQLVGGVPLSASQESAIERHKREILGRVGTGAPLTQEERDSLGRTMLMEAHLYNFTDAETEAIFEALKVQ